MVLVQPAEVACYARVRRSDRGAMAMDRLSPCACRRAPRCRLLPTSMTLASPLICLITPGHLSSTPRLVKEADALVEAGYRVHVVSGLHFAAAERLDRSILDNSNWSHAFVRYAEGTS